MLILGKFLHADKHNFAISVLGVLHCVDVGCAAEHFEGTCCLHVKD
jgi:hypothetical protein